MTWVLHRHDARRLSELLEPASVDLIVTSPPYFGMRSYRDACPFCDGAAILTWNDGADRPCPECRGTGRSHFDGQIGSEATPGEFVDALVACTRDWLGVLRPGGSLWVNLGDKYAGSGGHNNSGLLDPRLFAGGGPGWDETRNAPKSYNKASDGVRNKSLMGLPWRYALRCIDELGLILRAEVIWSKPNGLPESVTDRVRRSHEQWFHFVRQGRYFAAIDEVREEHTGEFLSTGVRNPRFGRPGGQMPGAAAGIVDAYQARRLDLGIGNNTFTAPLHPLGKAPGSVWSVPSEPLVVPDSLGVDHFAAYPSELPRRIILGWSPSGWCTGCGQPRRPVVDKRYEPTQGTTTRRRGFMELGDETRLGAMRAGTGDIVGNTTVTITGYACACAPYTDHPPYEVDNVGMAGTHMAPGWREYHTDGWTPPLTTPAVVVDPFAGTGTTVAVAHLLGRHGVGVDLSADYLRLAAWRCEHDRALRDKVLDRSGIPNPRPPAVEGQLDLFAEAVL